MMKDKFIFKKLSLFFVMAIFSLSFCCVEKVYAEEEYTKKICEYSEEYIEWTKLSDEEKLNTIMPPICDDTANATNRLKSNVKKSFVAFDKAKLPATYDIRNEGITPLMKDQMHTGSCWAFATTTALEIFTKVSLELDYVYSPRHIEYTSTRDFLNGGINEWGYNREIGTGGNAAMAGSYLINELGPILEEDMPFEDNEEVIELSEIQNKEVKLDVNNVVVGGANTFAPCNSTIITEMKEQIMESGSIVGMVNFSIVEPYYNSDTGALYYNGDEGINHAVTIVGWDDTYSKTNFVSSNQPSSDGAWLVQNSWGEEFGNSGYNYVSYSDNIVCAVYMGFNDVDTEFTDNSYIYDKLGHNVATGYQSGGVILSSAYGMAVYDKGSGVETLEEVAFGAVVAGSYNIYFAEGDASQLTIEDMTLIGSGTTPAGGYYTHKLTNPVYMDSDVSKFSIVVNWNVDSYAAPIPVSLTTTAEYFFEVVEEGRTFTSWNGYNWEDAAVDSTIVSIKAFTNDVDYTLSTSIKSVVKDTDDNINVAVEFTSTNVVKSNLNLVVMDDEDNYIDDFSINYEVLTGDIPTGATLVFPNGLTNGTYYINVYYQNNFIESIDFYVLFGLSSSKYTVDSVAKTILVTSPVSISSFLSNIEGNSSGVTKSGSSVSSGYVGTGMMIDDYVIVLKGDVTGDGLIKVNDVMKISKYTVEGTGLDESYNQLAADVTGDKLIKVNDVMKISKYTVEGGTL